MVCTLAGLWNLGSRILYQTWAIEVESSTCSMNMNKDVNYTGWQNKRIPATGWNLSLWMKWRFDGRGGDRTCYICNKLRGWEGGQIDVSRRMWEGTSWNHHWASSFKKYRRASKDRSLCSLQSTREVGMMGGVSRWRGRMYVSEEYKM